MENYVSRNEGRTLVAARSGDEIERLKVENFKRKKMKERLVKWREKTLYSQYFRQTEEIANKKP